MNTITEVETEMAVGAGPGTMDPRGGPNALTAGNEGRSGWEDTLVASLLSGGPGNLLSPEAILLLYRGQYLLCYKEGGREIYKPLTGMALRDAFSGQPVDTGWLPANTVRWGEGAHGKHAVRWLPPAVRRLLVEVDVPGPTKGRKQGVRTKIEEVQVPLPGLVFFGIGRSYYIWAVAGTSFGSGSQVFHAPLSNVWPSGVICWGSSPPPEVNVETFGVTCEAFFASTFNDHLMGKRCRSYPNDVRVQLLQLAASGATEYPRDDLLPFEGYVYAGAREVTIGDVIDSHVLKGVSSGG